MVARSAVRRLPARQLTVHSAPASGRAARTKHDTGDEHPGVRIILSHAGGFLPYASLRFAEFARVFDHGAVSSDAILASLRRFYFDTALSSGPALPTLMAFASPGHVLFGTDFPYDHGVSAAFTATLDSADSLTADDQTAISHGNAQALFPRLAAHDG